VKYTLTAVATCTKFLGGVQDINKHKEIDLVDHVHDSNYSNAVSIVGSSNTKMYTNNDRHLATATVSIARSAYRPGQVLTLSVDLAHPQKIRRDPGCWIQLIRKESYSAKEYVLFTTDLSFVNSLKLVHQSSPTSLRLLVVK
jgi:hypothetical protein